MSKPDGTITLNDSTVVWGIAPPAPFQFVLNGNDGKPVGTLTIDKGEVSFAGNADESASIFIEAVVKRWGQQWKAAQKRIEELEGRA